MFKTSPLQTGDFLAVVENQFWNRTGRTIYKGMIVMLDWAAAQAESTSIQPGGEGASIYGNVTIPTQTEIDAGYPLFVCKSDSIADNELGTFVLEGNCEVAIFDDDVSTTDVDADEALCILVSDNGGVGGYAAQAWATSAGGARRLGIAFEDAAASEATAARAVLGFTDGSGTVSHLRYCYWWGGNPGIGASDT